LSNVSCPKACGECCKVILLTNNKEITLQEQWKLDNDKDSKWFLKHLKQISIKEAFEIRPILRVKIWLNLFYFKCDQYNYETNKCDGYNKYRPSMCTNFPFYNKTVLDSLEFKAMPNCYYNNQIMKVN
jgi:Fe-S-cluster containining protein